MLARSSRPRGAVLAVVMVAILVILIIGTSMIRLGWLQRRQTTIEERRAQAQWLAESGLERAWAMLQKSADYQGETWKIPSAELGGRGDGVVTISIGPAPGKAGQFSVRAASEYPMNVTFSAQITKVVLMDRPATPQPEKSL